MYIRKKKENTSIYEKLARQILPFNNLCFLNILSKKYLIYAFKQFSNKLL